MFRPTDRFRNYLHQLFRRNINEPESIHTCRKTIRTAQPYICFVFLDTDSMPTATNIRLSRSYSDTLFRHRILRQLEPHVLHEGSLYSDAQSEKPVFRSFTLDAPTGAIDGSFPSVDQTVSVAAAIAPDHQREKPFPRSFKLDAPTGAIDGSFPSVDQPVSVAAAIDPDARREKPALRSFTLDAPTGVIDKSIAAAGQPVSVSAAIDPDHKREKPVARSFTLDAPTGLIDRAIPSAGQPVSLDVSCDFNKQEKEAATKSYIFENQSGRCIHETMNEDRKCDSSNISSWIPEPCRYDHNIFRHETKCRIVRFRRYSQISPGLYSK